MTCPQLRLADAVSQDASHGGDLKGWRRSLMLFPTEIALGFLEDDQISLWFCVDLPSQ